MSVPDHLIEKAAALLDNPAIHPGLRRAVSREKARAVLESVAGELREEGARAERERIAQEIEAMETPRSTTVHYTEIAERVREGGDTDAQ